METEFDLRRLHELEALLDSKLPAIVTTLIAELAQATDQVQAAIRSGNWAGAAQAAHAGRNSALMLDAGPLLEALGRVELAARDADEAAAAAAGAHLEQVWGALRARLQAAAREPG
jgi:hypothetical protein